MQTCKMAPIDSKGCLWFGSVKPVLLIRRSCAVGVVKLGIFWESFGYGVGPASLGGFFPLSADC